MRLTVGVSPQGKLVFVCNADCALEFKKTHNVTNLCEFCKMEKIARDAKRIDSKDCYFCSDGMQSSVRRSLCSTREVHVNQASTYSQVHKYWDIWGSVNPIGTPVGRSGIERDAARFQL